MNVVIFWDIAPYILHVNFQLIFYSEDGGDTFLRNVGSIRTIRCYIQGGNIQETSEW
jgi:hypothetical protein